MAHACQKDTLVLGLPRGGVPVAYEVAKKLKLPLEIYVVRKLGLPGHPELALGAIASGGVCVLNDEIVSQLGISELTIGAVAADAWKELARREAAYRGSESIPKVTARTIILVDDGAATGATIRAAVMALRQLGPFRIIVAVPVASPAAYQALVHVADEVVALKIPEDFHAVGQYYEDFPQTTDAEVRNLLERSRKREVADGGEG